MVLETCVADLQIAESAIERMAGATDLTDFQQAWQDFLFRIERAWEGAERSLRGQKGFQQWFKPYADLRRKDPLLRFLRQARNAETHGISDTVGKPLELLLRDKYGRQFDFRGAHATLKNGLLSIDIKSFHLPHDFDVSVVPTTPVLVKFKNRGEWYNPPTTHLKTPLNSSHPIDIARFGLSFYRAFVEESRSWVAGKKDGG